VKKIDFHVVFDKQTRTQTHTHTHLEIRTLKARTLHRKSRRKWAAQWDEL